MADVLTRDSLPVWEDEFTLVSFDEDEFDEDDWEEDWDEDEWDEDDWDEDEDEWEDEDDWEDEWEDEDEEVIGRRPRREDWD